MNVNSATDFSGGMVNTRGDIESSVHLLEDGLLMSGGVRRRGPTANISTLEAAASTSLKKSMAIGVLDDYIGVVRFEAGSLTHWYSSTDDGATFTDHGATAFGGAGGTFLAYGHCQAVVVGEEIIFGGSTRDDWWDTSADKCSTPFRWSGSQKTFYTTGTVTTTAGSATVTGSGTSWLTNVEAGMYFKCGNAGRPIRIKRVNSDTELELDGLSTTDVGPPAVVTGGYTITPLGPISAEFDGPNVENTWAADAGSSYTEVVARTIGSHQGRLFFGGTGEAVSTGVNAAYNKKYGSRIRWSALIDEAQKASAANRHAVGAGSFHRAAYEDIGPGIGGDIVGLQSLDRYLVVLKEGALFVLTGSFDTTNANSTFTVSRVAGAPGCVGVQAHAVGPFGVAYMSKRGMMLFDGSGYRNISSGRIRELDHLEIGDGDTMVSAVNNRIFVTTAQTGGSDQDTFVYDVTTDSWSKLTNGRMLSQVVAEDDGQREFVAMYAPDGTDSIKFADVSTHYRSATYIDEDNSNDAGDATLGPPVLKLRTNAIPLGGEGSRFGRPRYVDIGFTTDSANNTYQVNLYVGTAYSGIGSSLTEEGLGTHYKYTATVEPVSDDVVESVQRVRLFPSDGDNESVFGTLGPAYGEYAFVEIVPTNASPEQFGVHSVVVHSSPVMRVGTSV